MNVWEVPCSIYRSQRRSRGPVTSVGRGVQASLGEENKAEFASAQVFLGLTPTLLSSIAPTIGEICILSSNRPLLNFLLSLGCPSVLCFRSLTYDDPVANLRPQRTLFIRTVMRAEGVSATVSRRILSAFEYLLVLAAAANTLHASWTLGLQTVVSWKCQVSFLPFIWSILTIIVHLIASASWRHSEVIRSLQAVETLSFKRGTFATLWQWIVDEGTPCGYREQRGFLRSRKTLESRWIILANFFAQFVGSVS